MLQVCVMRQHYFSLCPTVSQFVNLFTNSYLFGVCVLLNSCFKPVFEVWQNLIFLCNVLTQVLPTEPATPETWKSRFFTNKVLVQVTKVNNEWLETDARCTLLEHRSLEVTSYELRGLAPDTFYKVEIRAHNYIGFSVPGQVVVKTAQGMSGCASFANL